MAFGRIMIATAMTAGLAGAPCVAAERGAKTCSLREAAEGRCADASLTPIQDPATPPQTTKRRDSLKNGAIIGGAIGLAIGLLGSGIADCPGDDPSGSCPWARVGGVVVSTAIFMGIVVGLDALVTERTNAVTPPASRTRNLIRTLPPRPSLAMTLRW